MLWSVLACMSLWFIRVYALLTQIKIMYLEKLASRSLAKHITWICVGMITLFAPCGWAATVTSVAAGGNWGTAATWVGSALPAVGDNVVIATTGANKVTVDGNYTNASITINSGAILSFDATARSLALACITNNGAITNNSTSPTHKFFFVSNGFWTGSGDISNVKALINVGAGVTLDASLLTTPIKFRSSGTFAPVISGTLITGTQTISGNPSTFTVSAGATIVTANPNGLINGAVGTLNLTTAPTISSGANFTFNGAAPQITAGLPAAVSTLTVNNSAGVTLSASTTVTNLALANGVLTTSGSAVPTIPATGAITGASFVNGPLAMVYAGTGARTFPVGKGGNSRSVNLNYTALTGTSTVTVEQFESPMAGTAPVSTSAFASRYWTVSQTGGSAFAYSLTLDGTGFTPLGVPVVLQQGTPDASYSATFSSPGYTAAGIAATGNFTLGDLIAGANQVVFTTTPQTTAAGASSGLITVQLQDNSGNPLTYATNYSINLNSLSVTGIFRDAADTATITSVTLLAGNNSVSFRYQDTKTGTALVSAAASGVATVSQTETTIAAAASVLAFSTQPVNGVYGNTLAAVSVQILDAYFNSVAQSGTPISLALNGASLAGGTVVQNTDATGKAVFNNLVISTVATGLNYTASASGFAPVTSANFNVSVVVITKAQNNTNLNVGSSWTGGIVPGVGNIVSWDSTSVGTSSSQKNADVGGSASWYGLQMLGWPAATSYTVGDASGTSVITLGPGGIVASTNMNHTLTFNPGLAFAAPQIWNWGTTNATCTFNGGITNNGFNWVLNGAANITFNGAISGPGGLTDNNSATVTFTNNNSFSGPLVCAAGAKIAGNGVLAAPVVVQSGGTLRAGLGGTDTTSALTINNNLTLGGTIIFYLNNTNAGAKASRVVGVNNLLLDGTLNPINVGPAYQAGDTFVLFQATNYSGAFTSLSPATPGVGLLWNTSNIAVNGSLSVVAAPSVAVLPVATNLIYGTPLTLTAIASGTGPLSLQWYDNNTNAIANATNQNLSLVHPSVADSGSYTVVVSSPFASSTNTVSVTVAPAPLTITANSDVKVYGQTRSYGAGSTAFVASGLQYSDTVGSITVNATGGTAATDSVGGYLLTPGAATGGTFNSANYSLVYSNGTLTVTPLAVALVGARPYDGTSNAAAAILSVANKIGADDVAVVSGIGQLAGAGVGSQPMVSFGSLTLGGAAANNYTFLAGSGSVSLAPATGSLGIYSSANPSGYQSGISFMAMTPADASGNVLFLANGVPFSTNALIAGSAVSLNLNSLPRATNIIAAIYSGDANYVSLTNSLAQIVTNHPPVAGNASYVRYAEMSTVRIAISDLLAAASDADGDSLALDSVSSSTNGITLVNRGGYLIYQGASLVNDQFAYTVTDGVGGRASGTVGITANSSSVFGSGIPRIVSAGNAVTLSFTGIPGLNYSVARSPDLMNWTVLGVTNAPAGGEFNFSDPIAQPEAFYRLQFNP